MSEQKIVLPETWAEWKIDKKLGDGSYGTTYLAKRGQEGHDFYSVIKVIDLPSQKELHNARILQGGEKEAEEYYQDVQKKFEEEMEWLFSQKLTANIITIEDFQVERDNSWRLLVRMEYLQNLSSFMKTDKWLSEKETIKLAIEVCTALTSFEEKGITHRGIKPQNIFRSDSGIYKLGDFDVLNADQHYESERGQSPIETIAYMAPELVKGEPYTSNADLYSLGLVLYQLMNRGKLPNEYLQAIYISKFEREEARQKRINGEGFKRPIDASSEFADVIMKACAYDPKLRFQNAAEMKEALLKLQEIPLTSVKRQADYSEGNQRKWGTGRKAGIALLTGALITAAAAVGFISGDGLLATMSENSISEAKEESEVQTEKQAQSQSEEQTKKQTKLSGDSEEENLNEEKDIVYEVITAGSNLNVHTGPDQDSETIGKLPNGATVIGTGEVIDDWVQVFYSLDGTKSDEIGWASAEFLNMIEETESIIAEEQPQTEQAQTVQHKICSKCGGSGAVATGSNSVVVCGICGGSGFQYIPNAYYDTIMGWQGTYIGCSGCGGSGYIVSTSYKTCDVCGGTGYVE